MRIKYRLIVYKDLLAWKSVKAENMFYSNIVKNNWKEKKSAVRALRNCLKNDSSDIK